MDKIKINLSQSQIRDAAMRQQGICPAKLAIKPGIRIEKNKKAEAKRGVTKHKRAQYAY